MIANYWYLQNLLSVEECNHIKKICTEHLDEARLEDQENVDEGRVDYSIRKAKTCFIRNNSPLAEELKNELEKIIWKLRTASIEIYNCELNFIEPIQFGQYGKDEYYNWHLDAGPDFDRDISASIFLDDPKSYEGGDFEFQTPTLGIPCCQAQGSIMIFPSLLSHRVKPVTKGVRHSLVIWGTNNQPVFKDDK